jgi:RNA polymerase sigma-70 factor (ECF subfamily)
MTVASMISDALPPSARRPRRVIAERPTTGAEPAPRELPRVVDMMGLVFQARVVAALPDLQRRASRLTENGSDAADIVQETCRRALEAREQFTTGSDLKPWLFTILRNVHLDHARRARRLIHVEAHDDLLCSPEVGGKPLWTRVSDDDLERALSELPPLYRDVYTLHAVDHVRYEEIALRLGIPTNTVGTRLRRARLHLRASLLRRLGLQQEVPASRRSRTGEAVGVER